MSARVDVLAVMGRMATASFVAADDHPDSSALQRLQRDAEIARAAVAELIEAASAIHIVYEGKGNKAIAVIRGHARLEAALAGVQP